MIMRSRDSYTWIAYDNYGISVSFQVGSMDHEFVVPVLILQSREHDARTQSI